MLAGLSARGRGLAEDPYGALPGYLPSRGYEDLAKVCQPLSQKWAFGRYMYLHRVNYQMAET